MPCDREMSIFARLFPVGFVGELKQLLKLAWPAALGHLFTFSLTSTALIFCGHLGKNELAAAGLAITIINVTGVFICTGLATACETLFAQAYGGKNLELTGIYLQRSTIIVSLTCLLCWAVHLNIEWILVFLKQDVAVRRLTTQYLQFFMPGLIFNFWFQVCLKFLQARDVVIPVVIVGLIGNIFNIVAQYVAIHICKYGIRGSAVAQALSWVVMCTAILIYIRTSGMLEDTWKGWSWRAFENWGDFMKLALGGLAMMLSEWCLFEGAVIASGALGVVQQASTEISQQIEWIAGLFLYGISTACSIRVGQHLGANEKDGAKTTYRVTQIAALCGDCWKAVTVVENGDVASSNSMLSETSS